MSESSNYYYLRNLHRSQTVQSRDLIISNLLLNNNENQEYDIVENDVIDATSLSNRNENQDNDIEVQEFEQLGADDNIEAHITDNTIPEDKEDNNSTNNSLDDISSKCDEENLSDKSSDTASEELNIEEDTDDNEADLLENYNLHHFLESFASSYNFDMDFDIEDEATKRLSKVALDILELNGEELEQKQDFSDLLKDWEKLKLQIDNSEKSNLVSSFISKYYDSSFEDFSTTIPKKQQSLKYFQILTYDCCPEGHCVFIGENKNKMKCPYPECKDNHRYHNCTKPNCVNKSYEDSCSTHPNTKRYNKASISYRSIKLLMRELVQLESFREAIKYHDTYINLEEKKDTVFSKNMKEMKQEFLKFVEKCKSSSDYCDFNIIEINLVISWFYDSFMAFHRKTGVFAPIIITIKNLPPNLKNQLGFGTFLLSLLTYAPGSAVEKFILFDCFIGELLLFHEGVSIIIDNSDGTKTLYRIQIRLCIHILDMPALCKIMNFESCFNSTYGCPFCNWGKGYYDPLIRKCKYFNTGYCMGMKGYFNLFGNTQQCMPYDKYIKSRELNHDEKINNSKLIEACTEEPLSKKPKKSMKKINILKVINHTGLTVDDLSFNIELKKDNAKCVVKWCENDTLHSNKLILEYLKKNKQLSKFYNEQILGIIETPKQLNEKIVKKSSKGYHKDQIYVEELKLSHNPSLETKEQLIARENALKTYLQAPQSYKTSASLFLNVDCLGLEDCEYNKLSDDVMSIDCDFRKCEHYKPLSTDEYILRVLTLKNMIESKIDGTVLDGTKQTVLVFKGCKDWWMFLIVPSVLIEHLGFEPAHVIFNISKQIIDLWKGSPKHRQNLPGVKAYCKLNNVHPSIWDNTYIKEWEFTKEAQTRTQDLMNCLLIPKGCGDKCKFVNHSIFQRSGQLKGMGRVNIMKTFMNLILFSNSKMRPSYKALFRTYSCILTKMLVKYPDPDDLLILFWRCVEFRTFFEKLVPVTEMTMNIHALPEVCLTIKKHDSIYDCWACPGERAHSTFKQLIHTNGGTRPELNVWAKYSVLENNNIISNYGILKKMIEGSKDIPTEFKSRMCNLSYDNNKNRFVYNDEKVETRNVHSTPLNEKEFDNIVNKVFNEILQFYSNDLYRSCDQSSAFRVFYVIIQRRSDSETNYQSLLKLISPINKILKLKEFLILNPSYIAKQIENIPAAMNNLKNLSVKFKKLPPNGSILELLDLLETELVPLLSKPLIFSKHLKDNLDLQKDIFFIRSFIIKRLKHHDDLQSIIENVIRDYTIVDIDVETMQQILQWKKKFYISTKLWMGGTIYRGRGFGYSESNSTTSNNKLNDIEKEWFNRTQYSSWVKLKPFKGDDETRRNEKPIYALLNYTFNFSKSSNIISCPFLNEHLGHISSITSYQCSIQHRENIIIHDKQGNRSQRNKYSGQVPQSDPFHNSRLPYLRLSSAKPVNDKINSGFVISSTIYQSAVATIGFSKFETTVKKTNKTNINYKAIDTFSEYNDGLKKNKNKVNIKDPNCSPHILVFIDVSPEVMVQPESNNIKQEIKGMHQIWIDNEKTYDSDSSGSTSDEEIETENDSYVEDIAFCVDDNKIDSDLDGGDNDNNDADVEEIEIIFDDFNDIEINNNNNNNNNNNEIVYYGFKWLNNSCAFDSLITIMYYAFVVMSPNQKQLFKLLLGRFGEIIQEMHLQFGMNNTFDAFESNKEEILDICYKCDHVRNFDRHYIPQQYFNRGYILPSYSRRKPSTVIKSEVEFLSGNLNLEEFSNYISNGYHFNNKLGDLLSVSDILNNLLRFYNEPFECDNSYGESSIFSIVHNRFYICNNDKCKDGYKIPFNYKANVYSDIVTKYTSFYLLATNESKNVTELLNNYIDGIVSKADINVLIKCQKCNENKIIYKRIINSFPLLLQIITNGINYNFETSIQIIHNDKVIKYVLAGVIYGNGTHFTSSIFMENSNKLFFYDGMKGKGKFQESPKNKVDFKTDLKGRKTDCVIYRKIE